MADSCLARLIIFSACLVFVISSKWKNLSDVDFFYQTLQNNFSLRNNMYW